MALLHLLARLAPARGLALQAVTVDHRLRAASAGEAAFVARTCASLGIPHTVLVWDHGPLHGNLMEQARLARRALIADWAKGGGVQAVALAHTADDQAEGLLMALARESGLDGLSGMPPVQRQGGLWWTRPLLGVTRASLRDWLGGQGLSWIDDPTNDDTRFLRTRVRQVLPLLEGLGLTIPGLARSALHLASARHALVTMLAEFARSEMAEAAGALDLPRSAFASLATDQQRRLLTASVAWIGCALHPPRRSGQLQALSALLDGRSTTLGGVRFRVGPRIIRIVREPRACGAAMPVGACWDGRWQLDGPPGPEVRALGAAGLAQIPGWRACGLSRDALVVSPGVWDGARLIAAPAAGFGTGYKAKITPDFASFLLSH